jgi:ribonuclease HI
MQQQKAWTRPPIDHVKVNFDPAFCVESGEGAWGFIARSDAGEFIARAAGELLNLKDALQAEVEACVAAAEGAAALGLNHVLFESDSKTLVSALSMKNDDLSVIGVVLKDVQSICVCSFESFQFQFSPHSCNGVANSLAQYGLRANSECNGWEGQTPHFVFDLVASIRFTVDALYYAS